MLNIDYLVSYDIPDTGMRRRVPHNPQCIWTNYEEDKRDHNGKEKQMHDAILPAKSALGYAIKILMLIVLGDRVHCWEALAQIAPPLEQTRSYDEQQKIVLAFLQITDFIVDAQVC